jgi:hypothetical protein
MWAGSLTARQSYPTWCANLDRGLSLRTILERYCIIFHEVAINYLQKIVGTLRALTSSKHQQID